MRQDANKAMHHIHIRPYESYIKAHLEKNFSI